MSPPIPAVPPRSGAESLGAEELERSFAAFTQISRSLERAYERLREQAARVDVALAQSNERLAEKVAELDASTGHLHAVLASLRTAMVVTDLDGRVTLVNRAFAETCRKRPSELLGRPKSGLVDDRGQPLCEPGGAGAGTTEAVLPNRVVLLNGERRVVRSSIAAVRGGDGRALGEVEAIIDETEVEALREELRRRETLTALGEMAAGIAHELRNPLTAIDGFAHLLRNALPEGSAECADHARRISQGVRKANSIITNLMCFARPERFRPRRARLATLFTELRHAFLEKPPHLATVEVRAPEPPELGVACDLALIERVLVNLVENARLAAGGAGRVVVQAKAARGEVVLTVEDDGPGIAPELRDRLFRPFVTGRPDGTGLGLFLVHRIVELHQGRVAAGDRKGGGTVFTVRLPDVRADARAIPRPEPDLALEESQA